MAVCSIPQPRAAIRAEETWQAAGGSVGLRRSMAQADRKPCVSQKKIIIKNPGDSQAADPEMLPSGCGPLVPDPVTLTAGGLGRRQHQPGSRRRLTQTQQSTISAKVAETGKNEAEKKLLEVNGQGGSEL